MLKGILIAELSAIQGRKRNQIIKKSAREAERNLLPIRQFLFKRHKDCCFHFGNLMPCRKVTEQLKEQPHMWNADEIKGKGKQIIGKLKENLGNAAEDHKAEAEGRKQRIEGENQESFGRAHRKTEEVREKLED
jgi:uncharacterized protein YjbJ (UPF0337 family)